LILAVLTCPNRAFTLAYTSSSVGKRVVALGFCTAHPASVTDELLKGPEWPLFRRCCSPRLLSRTNVVFERSPVLHAPCGSCHWSSFHQIYSISPLCTAQMIDKVWYDWQNKHPMNKYAYEGGSVTPIPSFANYTIFPNGLPPDLNVSGSSDENS